MSQELTAAIVGRSKMSDSLFFIAKNGRGVDITCFIISDGGIQPNLVMCDDASCRVDHSKRWTRGEQSLVGRGDVVEM